MARVQGGRLRLRIILVLFAILHLTRAQNEALQVTIRVLRPKGVEAYVTDVPGMSFFAFNGHINRSIAKNNVGSLRGEVLEPVDGKWLFRDTNVQLRAGDVINYYIFVTISSAGYLHDNLRYTVSSEDVGGAEPPVTDRFDDCKPTLTVVRGAKACAGQTIFEDNFDDFRSDQWQIEQYIPIGHPEYPFVSYQRPLTNTVVTVSDGYLRITPKLQQTMPGFTNESIYSGTLDLFSGCTASADVCYRQASGPDILPPVVSGRVTSSSFAFTYGTVFIKAKLPQGDWIYPELLLEPFLRKYGRSNYASGVIKIAAARGNKELRKAPDEYGNKVLYGGPVMDSQCRHELVTNNVMPGGKLWGDDFHEYSVEWTPEKITLSVDGQEWAQVDSRTALRDRFPGRCTHLPRMLLARGTNLAPFDDNFYLTLGVAAGGISEFPDFTYSNGREKPWINTGRKAMLTFWEETESWKQTWTQPELIVDYVKVVAL